MKRFAFDLGTQSIGWCVLSIDHEIPKLEDLGVRVFPDGREPGRNGRMGDPLNLKRRTARQLRKNLERRKRRKAAMYRFLDASGLSPDQSRGHEWRNLDPYNLRAQALSRDLSPLELGRVLMNLATRRGFKSNRKTDAKDAEAKGQALRQKNLLEKLGSRTLGEYLAEQHRLPGQPIRFRAGSEFYPTRAMYEEEFSRIRARQEQCYPSLDWDRAFRIIFFQRPLKRPERAPCTFYPEEYRGYRAQPSAQLFRILQDVANLQYQTRRGQFQCLDANQRAWLISTLQKQRTLSFDKLRSKLGIEGSFNLESARRTELKGDSTSCEMRKVLGDRWDSLSLEVRDALVEALIIEEDDERLRHVLREVGVSEEHLPLALSIDFPTGTTSDSARFMREVGAIMLRESCRYDEAVKALGLHHSALPTPGLRTELPYYGEVLRYATVRTKPAATLSEADLLNPELLFGRIPNPTVHIALNQLRKLVNALVARHGMPDEIVLEFATELKKGRKALDEILKRQEENQKQNNRVRTEIRDLLGKGQEYRPSRTDIRKHLLWEELGHDGVGRLCVYCGKPISESQLMNGEAEIEHIIPFSRSLDDGMSNLTAAHKRCNAAKGNRTPFEAFGSSPPGFDWEGIQDRAKRFRQYRKRLRFSPDVLEQIAPGGDFIASQLTDTAYIAKAARDYLACICDPNKIWAIPGQLTATFREQWGLNTILSSGLGKNRCDHRHHALDAIVVGLTDRGMLQEAARANAALNGGTIKAPPFALDRDEVIDRLKTVLVSIKPDHGTSGSLLAETAYGYRKKAQTSNHEDSEDAGYEYHVRKPLRALSYAEARQRIRDVRIAEQLKGFLDRHGIDGKTDPKRLALALAEFEKETGIQRVRICPKNEAGYLHLGPERGDRTGAKAYQYADILCTDIWMIPKGNGKFEYQGDFFKRGELPPGIEEPEPRRPESGAKLLMRLFKNDTIRIRLGDKETYARIAGFASTTNKLDIQPLFSTSNIKDWLESTSPLFLDRYWQAKNGQNHVSINALFQRKTPGDGISKVAISIDGRTRRR